VRHDLHASSSELMSPAPISTHADGPEVEDT
jgi:hypothetical protein